MTTCRNCSYYDRKRIHNLKYYTWVEQQGRSYEEIVRRSGMIPTTGPISPAIVDEMDALIEAFNKRVGLLDEIEKEDAQGVA